MIMSKQLEDELRDSFCKFRRIAFNTISKIEVPVFARSVDLVEFNKDTNELTAIEFKINDWKRALNQLHKVESCFDYLILCIPSPKTKKCMDRIEKACNEGGVGLFYWSKAENLFMHACVERKTSGIWDLQKSHIIDYLSDGGIENE